MYEYMFPLAACVAAAGIGAIFGRFTSGAAELRKQVTARDEAIQGFKDAARSMGRQLAELRAERQRRLAPLRAANARRHAKAEAKKAAAKAIMDARHDEMRATIVACGLGEAA